MAPPKDSYSAYYPPNEAEEAYLMWLEGPGEGLAAVVGAAPSFDEQVAAMRRRRRLALKKPRGQKRVEKALPKKDKDDKPVKKAPQNKASKKQAGATGKTRYSYPQEQQGGAGGGGGVKQPPPKQNPVPVPDDDPKPLSADPVDLANQLHMSVATLQRVAQRFVDNKKLDGRKGFVQFMRTRMKGFSSKHRLDGDYWGLIFDALVSQSGARPPRMLAY